MHVSEKFRPHPMGVNANYQFSGTGIAGFLAKTSGTITVIGAAQPTVPAGTVLVDAVPVTAGIFTPIPLKFTFDGVKTVTLGGGASGTLFV